jgi:hypothetical protein
MAFMQIQMVSDQPKHRSHGEAATLHDAVLL